MTMYISIMLTIGQIVGRCDKSVESSEIISLISSRLLSPQAWPKWRLLYFHYFNRHRGNASQRVPAAIFPGNWNKIWNISIMIILFTLKMSLISLKWTNYWLTILDNLNEFRTFNKSWPTWLANKFKNSLRRDSLLANFIRKPMGQRQLTILGCVQNADHVAYSLNLR